jgi:TATA-box binding protein (TBP) (component of TFIID and TFIIIB)
MDHKFQENMEEIFDIEPIEIESTDMTHDEKIEKISDDIEKDYERARAELYSLISKGQEAVNGILDVAQNTDHPRAYEVAFQGIKSVADITEKLADLQKKMKDIKTESKKSAPTTVNNTMFVGSTADLAKMLKNASKNLNNQKGK